MDYKIAENEGHQGQLKKSWILNYEAENQSSDLLCPSSFSNFCIQLMKQGISPLEEIQKNFGEDIPIFDDIFFHCLDHFIQFQNNEGMKLLEFLFCKNIKNVASFYGEYSIPIIMSTLPNSFQILTYLLSFSLSPMANQTFYSNDWISPLQPFIENTDYHLFLAIIFRSIEPLKIREEYLAPFFNACESLLNSSNKEAIINILYGFQDHFFLNFKQEICEILIRNYSNLLLMNRIESDQTDAGLYNEIIQYLLLSFSKIINDETIKIIDDNGDNIFHFLFDSLLSNNEDILYAASELVSALVSFDQAHEFLTSPDVMDKIFELASDSPFSIRKNMISTLCDLIKQQSTEPNLMFLSRGILDLLIDFLDTDQNDNTLEVVEGIQYLIESIEETDKMNLVVDKINENKYSFEKLDEREIENISRVVKRILDSIQNHTIENI